MPYEGIQLDLQKQLFSGVNSPAPVASPSCEVRNELVFPSFQTAQPTPAPAPVLQQQQSYQEPAKVTPKISQLSELDQQLSKLHNQRPVLTQPQGQTYSEAVRQSPTTVQQQFVQTNVSQQVQAPSQQMPINPVHNIQAVNQVASPVPSQIQAPAASDATKKFSRFVISKVNEEPKPQPQQQPPQQQQQQQFVQNQPSQQQVNQVLKSVVNSPENDQQVQIQQNVAQSPGQVQQIVPSQQNQAQMFFQQHHGGVVS